MKSKDKIDVLVRKMYGKNWMLIKIKRGNELVPSFEDWFRMIQALSFCERGKYKSVEDPLDLPKRFLMRCFDENVTWEQIREEFNIPNRD